MGSNKLQNIKAIKQLLNGTHRTQTRKTFHFDTNSSKLDLESRKRSANVGDAIVEEYTNSDGTPRYRTHFCLGSNTFKIVNGKWDSKEVYDAKQQEIRDILNPFRLCLGDNESCTKNKPSAIDYRLAKKTGMCDSCLAKYELRLQISGEFKKYAMDKMRENLKSWMRDQEIELKKWKDSLYDGVTYLNNSEGNSSSIENWEGDVDSVAKKFEAEFMEMKREMYKNYGIVDVEE
jgi:hypothetical protein